MIRFSYTIFYVSDVAKAAQFYASVFELEIRFIHESGTYAEIDTQGVTLAFASEGLAETNLPGGFKKNSLKEQPQACEVAFTTDDPDALHKKAVKAGAIPLAPPQKKPWGQTVGYVRDPFGILIEIANAIHD